MRRTPAVLATATALAIAGGILGATPASAAPDGPNAHSLHGQCTSAAAGQHLGWAKHGPTERRNVGGTCEAR